MTRVGERPHSGLNDTNMTLRISPDTWHSAALLGLSQAPQARARPLGVQCNFQWIMMPTPACCGCRWRTRRSHQSGLPTEQPSGVGWGPCQRGGGGGFSFGTTGPRRTSPARGARASSPGCLKVANRRGEAGSESRSLDSPAVVSLRRRPAGPQRAQFWNGGPGAGARLDCQVR